MRTKKIIYLLTVMLVIISIGSCKTKKRIVASAPIVDKVDDKLFADVIDNQFDFNTFSSRVSLKFSSTTRTLSSRSQLRIIKDQAIQFSVQPLFGVEMLRLYIDRDSLLLLDRMNKQYIQESLADVKEKYPIGFDFTTLQALLINNLFVSGNAHPDYADYELFSMNQRSEMHYRLSAVDNISGIAYGFSVDGNDRITQSHLYEPKRQYEVIWDYDQFALRNGSVFPYWMNVMLATPKREVNIGMEFSSIELDEGFNLELSVPKSYSKAELSKLLKLITSI